VEDEVLSACEELGTTLVAYSPLGRGMLTGSFSRDWKPEGWDFRAAAAPRFRGEAMDNNLALVAEIERVAEDAGCTPAQVALAWVLARSESVVTIPGTTKVENLDGNLAAAAVQLDGDQTARLDALAESVKGDRYSEAGMAAVDG
jgi:aryl-alcohol dehydrogenase-like predicted oxidoreductase